MERYIFLLALIPLALLVAIVALVVWLVRRGSSSAPVNVGRVYRYLMLLISAGVATWGLSLLLQAVGQQLAPGTVILDRLSSSRVAQGIAMLIVGGVVWALHWSFAAAALKHEPQVERASALRAFYFFGALFLAMALFTTNAVSLFRWLFQVRSFDESSAALPGLISWGLLWLFHWLIVRREQPRPLSGGTLAQLYLYITSAYTLVLLAIGSGMTASHWLAAGYNALTDIRPVLGTGTELWTRPVRTSLSVALAGGILWLAHWRFLAAGDRRTPGRALLDFAALLGGSAAMLGALFAVVAGLVWWFIAAPGALQSAAHFRFLPGALAAFGAGALVVVGHYLDFLRGPAEISDRQVRARAGLLAVYSLTGLISLSLGLIIFIALLVGTLFASARGLFVDANWWRAPLASGLVSLLVGLPLWLLVWFRWKPQGEPGHRYLRRIYLYLALGLAILAFTGSATHVLFSLLRAFLDDARTQSWLQDARWSLGVVLTTVPIALYHWTLLRETREEGQASESPTTPPASLALVTLGSSPLADRVAAVLSAHNLSRQALPTGAELGRFGPDQLDALAAAVQQHAGGKLTLFVDGDFVRLFASD